MIEAPRFSVADLFGTEHSWQKRHCFALITFFITPGFCIEDNQVAERPLSCSAVGVASKTGCCPKGSCFERYLEIVFPRDGEFHIGKRARRRRSGPGCD